MNFVLLLLVLFCPVAFSAPATEDFAKLPLFAMPSLSPDGESLAFIITRDDKPAIVTRPLLKTNKKYKPAIIPLDGLQVNELQWVNNNRLLVKVRMTVKRNIIGLVNLTRIFSINRDGSDLVFFDMEPNQWGYYAQHPDLIHDLPEDPDHVLLALDHHQTIWGSTLVHKVNVNTGKRTLVERNSKGFSYMISDNIGNVRVGVRALRGGTQWAMFIKEKSDDSWTLLQKESYGSDDLMRPLRFDYTDNNVLLITSKGLEDDNYDEDDHDIYRYDLVQKKVIGKYHHKARESAKATIKNVFPDMTVNLVSWVDNLTLDRAIYKLYSDVKPPQYVIYDLKSKVVDYLGSSYPQLEKDNSPLSPMLKVNYKARDGLNIPAYLTMPKGVETMKLKPPLIVYPHGGPWARDYWGFDNYVQFFASQSYAVFQPQFRGSEGFGAGHLEAGYKQWGLAIQDDITDGVDWLIKEGKVDPEKICIVGASFGGYAAVMGLIRTPELYKCAISINGVLDMKLFHDKLNYLIYAKLNKEIVNADWGVKKVSPYHLRDKIKAPLLLIAGEKDTVVDKKHSISLYKKQKKKGKVEYIELPKGEHWRTIESNEITKLKAMEKFLKRYLKPEATKSLSI